MDGDENPRFAALTNGPETARSISVGRFRPVAATGVIADEFRGLFCDFAESGQKWRARQDSNLRPPA